jgi:MFS family permease
MNGVGIVSWFLTPVLRSVGITQPVRQLSLQLGLSIWNLLVSYTVALHVDQVGRRPLFLSSQVGMVIMFAIVCALSAAFQMGKGSNYGVAAVPFLYLYYGVYNLAWVPLPYAYASEVLPYNLRAKGMALFILAQNFGNAFNQFANPVALAAITWRYYLVYIGVDTLYFFLIYFCYPETSKMAVEEAALIFDYGGVKDGREKAIAAMQNLREARERANKEEQKIDDGHGKGGAVSEMIERV